MVVSVLENNQIGNGSRVWGNCCRWEEDLSAKKPIVKIGAEIPFTRYFYKYQQPEPSEVIQERLLKIEEDLTDSLRKLFGK